MGTAFFHSCSRLRLLFVWVTVAVMTMVQCTPISVGYLSIGLGVSLRFFCTSWLKLFLLQHREVVVPFLLCGKENGSA